MRELVFFQKDQVLTSSRIIAQAFGKKHKNVLRSIKNIECSEEFNRLNFAPVKYVDAKGEKRLEYAITKDGFSFLVMGFTGAKAAKFKEAFINAFNENERLLKEQSNNYTPNFVKRYWDNAYKLPDDHFSVITEMYVRLYQRLELLGYKMTDISPSGKTVVPDISIGKGFAKVLKDRNSNFYGTHKKYIHQFPDGRTVKANMYHIDALPEFIKYLNRVWIPKKAATYFKDRDPSVLEYLPKLLKPT